jgi:hypothetical protein
VNNINIAIKHPACTPVVLWLQKTQRANINNKNSGGTVSFQEQNLNHLMMAGHGEIDVCTIFYTVLRTSNNTDRDLAEMG